MRGVIIEESLEDPSLLKSTRIAKTEIGASLGWHLHTVEVQDKAFPAFVERAKRAIKPKWYMHFWKGNRITAIFQGKSFQFDYKDKKTWKEVLAYGRSLGIPEEQLNFPIES